MKQNYSYPLSHEERGACVHHQEGCSAPREGWIAAEGPGQSLSMCHPNMLWGSHSLGATLACVLMSHMCSWRIPETSNGSTSGYAWSTSGVRVAAYLHHPCNVCAMNHFLPFLFYLGEPLSYLHKITFRKHLSFSVYKARLHMSIGVNNKGVVLKDELCQDLYVSVSRLNNWLCCLCIV